MKKVILMMVAAMLMAACATLTPEEKAAREAERVKNVRKAVGTQNYRISVNTMKPMRGSSHSVFDSGLIVEGNSVVCHLPYAGLDDIPHPKTRYEVRQDSKLEFKSDIENYLLEIQPEKKRGIITFKADDAGRKYEFHIVIENDGDALIRVIPEGRDYIEYEGTINSLK